MEKKTLENPEVPLTGDTAAKFKIIKRLAELEDKAKKKRLLPAEFDRILEEELVALGVVKRKKRRIAMQLQERQEREEREENLVVETLQTQDEKGEPETHYYVFNDQGKELSRYASVGKEFFDRLSWLRQMSQQAEERAKERGRKTEAQSKQRQEIANYFFGAVEKLIDQKKFYRGKYRHALGRAVESGIIKEINKTEAEKLLDKKYLIEFWDWPEGKRITKFFQYCGRGEVQSEVFWALKKRFQYEMTACEREKQEREEKKSMSYIDKKMGREHVSSSESKPEKPDWKEQLAKIQEDLKEEEKGKGRKKKEKKKKSTKPRGKVKGGRKGAKQNLTR
jgi:hypothetical protein